MNTVCSFAYVYKVKADDDMATSWGQVWAEEDSMHRDKSVNSLEKPTEILFS